MRDFVAWCETNSSALGNEEDWFLKAWLRAAVKQPIVGETLISTYKPKILIRMVVVYKSIICYKHTSTEAKPYDLYHNLSQRTHIMY